jgi:hypothetical protein
MTFKVLDRHWDQTRGAGFKVQDDRAISVIRVVRVQGLRLQGLRLQAHRTRKPPRPAAPKRASAEAGRVNVSDP